MSLEIMTWLDERCDMQTTNLKLDVKGVHEI